MAHKLLIDGNSLGYANQHGTRLSVGSQDTQAIFGMVKSMKKLIGDIHPDSKPLVLWDGRAEWRFESYPEYKSNRDDSPEKVEIKASYESQKPFIQLALQYLGIPQLTCLNAEADDMAGVLVRRNAGADQITLVSGDQDWIQLINEKVSWFDPIRDRRVNLENILKETGYATPEKFLDGKCLTGDTSDKISGVGGIGEGTAPLFIAEFGSVEGFYKQVESGAFVPRLKTHKRLCGACEYTKEEWAAKQPLGLTEKELKKYLDSWPGQGRILYARNRMLMDLIHRPDPDPAMLKINKGRYDEEKFKHLCQKLAFGSILLQFETWMAPFRPK